VINIKKPIKGGVVLKPKITQLRLARMVIDTGGAKSLAEKLGMNHALLTSVERGQARCPSKWQSILSQVVGFPVEALFDDRGLALPASGVFPVIEHTANDIPLSGVSTLQKAEVLC
jgi:hypothetical protein